MRIRDPLVPSSSVHRHACCGLTRRRLLAASGWALAGGAAALAPGQALAFDPRSWFGAGEAPGHAIVKVLEGRAFADEVALAEGDTVPSGARVHVAEGGRAVISASDGSIFQVYGGASVQLLLNMMKEGLLYLLQGALLAVVPLGNRYVARGPTAAVGIKGTVFFHQVFGPHPAPGQSMDGPVPVPHQAREYFCLCHGAVEFRRADDPAPVASDRGEHHSAHFLEPSRPHLLAPAPMMNHDDDEILRLVALQEPPRHDTSWITGRRMQLPR